MSGRWTVLAVSLCVLPALGQVPAVVQPTVRISRDPDAGTPGGVAILVNPLDRSRSAVLVAEGAGGLATYALDGGLLGRFLTDGGITDVDVRTQLPIGFGTPVLVASVDPSQRTLLLFEVNPADLSLRPVTISGDFDGGIAPQAVALSVSPDLQHLYVFVAASTGQILQFEILPTAIGAVQLQLVRNLGVASSIAALESDDRFGLIFAALPNVGIERFSANPDAGTSTELIVTLPGSGPLVAPTGLGLFDARDGGFLLSANTAPASIVIFRRGQLQSLVGSFGFQTEDAGQGVESAQSVAVTPFPLGPSFPAGLLVATLGDVDQTQIVFVGWDRVANAFNPPLQIDVPLLPDGGFPDGDGGFADGGGQPGADGGGGSPGAGPGSNPFPNVPTETDDGKGRDVGCNCQGAPGLIGLWTLGALFLIRARWLGRKR